jgi:hypothetical protein
MLPFAAKVTFMPPDLEQRSHARRQQQATAKGMFESIRHRGSAPFHVRLV